MGRKNGLKTYRVSYYLLREIENGRAPMRFTFVHATTADEALDLTPSVIPTLAQKCEVVTLKAYPYYRAKQTKRVSGKKTTWVKVDGPQHPSTKQVLKDLDGMVGNDEHERMMDQFQFPDRPVVPTKPAVFDALRYAIENAVPFDRTKIIDCPWHGKDYIVDGRCTRLDNSVVFDKPTEAPAGTAWVVGDDTFVGPSATMTMSSAQTLVSSTPFSTGPVSSSGTYEVSTPAIDHTFEPIYTGSDYCTVCGCYKANHPGYVVPKRSVWVNVGLLVIGLILLYFVCRILS